MELPTPASPTPRKTAPPEGLQVMELLQVLKLRKRLILVLMMTAVLGVVARQVLYIPLFTAQTQLSVQKIENSPMQMALANLGTLSIDTSDRLKKYVEYLQSHEFFLVVAETLKFKEEYHRLNLTPPSELSITKKKFWKQFLASNFGNQGKRTEPQSANPEPVLVPIEQLATLIRSVTHAEISGPDSLRIRTTTLDPLTSMVLTNVVAEVFTRKSSERDYNEVTEVKRFIEKQLDSTTERLKKSESSLVDFKRHHNIISISAEHSTFTAKLTQLESDLESTRIKFEENQKLIDFYERLLSRRESQILAKGAGAIRATQSEVVSRLRQRLEQLHNKKVLLMSQGYAEGAWQVEEVTQELDRTAALLKAKTPASGGENLSSETTESAESQETSPSDLSVTSEGARAKLTALRNENRQMEAKISTLERSRSSLYKTISSLPKEEQILLTLNKDLDLQFELYSMLKKKLQEVEIQQVALQSRVMITERASMGSPAPRAGLLVKVLFAVLVSLFLGGTTAFALEALDPTIKHLSDLERMEVMTLGSIPKITASEIRQQLGARGYRPDLLVCKDRPESSEAMAFKFLRAQITRMKAPDGSPSRIIAFTSAERGDGKSLVASNTAVSLSQLEKKVLLIDCDFRNASVPLYFGYREDNGLTSLLTLRSSLDEVLLKEFLPYVDILPTGWTVPNPTELISNEKFRLLLDHLRSLYDYIIVDAPPAAALVDASVIAALADSTILVTSFRKTRKPLILVALRRIFQVSHKQVYGILNSVWEPLLFEGAPAPISGFHSSGDDDSPMDAKAEMVRFSRNLKKRGAA